MRLIFFLLLTLMLSTAYGQVHSEFYIKVESRDNLQYLNHIEIVDHYHCTFTLEGMQNTYRIWLNQEVELAELIRLIDGKISYEYIEPVPEHHLLYTPNDLHPSQYNLNLVNAQQAWDINNNASSIVIAITDDAVDLMHSDLAPNVWTNTAEIAGNGIDDDANGFIDDVFGWDFGDGDNNPNPPSAATNHGTHVAGIASAATNNGMGIAALGSNAKLMAVKMSQTGTPGLSNTIEAVDYAVGNGANVVNMSWGGGMFAQTFQDLFDIAYAQGVICVAAAGNSNFNGAFYPAKYNHVIAVGSTDQLDQKSSFSNYGSDIDLAAPGSDIYSTFPSNQYGTLSGTSMATPLVSGIVALMLDANPLASVDEIKQCLVTTCDPVNGAYSSQLGGGRVNAFEALKCITTPNADFNSDFTQVCVGGSVQYFNYSSGPGLSFNWTFPGGTPGASNIQNPIVTYNTPGTYDVSLTVSNASGSQSNTINGYITVGQPSAVISGYSSITAGGYGSVSISFTGNSPFNIVITDGTNSYPINNITTNPYVHFFNPTASSTYTLTSFSDSQCTGTVNGSALIDVTPPAAGGNCDTNTVSMVKYLGTINDDMGHSVIDIGQYGYLILGRKHITASSFRSYICRLDKCGTLLWEKVYNPSLYNFPVTAVMDGNEILVGTNNSTSTTSNNGTTGLLRLDLSGNVISKKHIDPSNYTHYPRSLLKLSDGNLLFAGVVNQTPSLGANDSYVTKSQTDGTIIWRQRFGGTANDFCHNAMEDSNGDILALGYQRDYTTIRSGYLAKLDANGNMQWMKRFDMGAGITYFNHITELNGYYYVVGSVNNGTYGDYDALLVKVDFNGNMIWSKKIGGPAFERSCGIDSYNDTLYLQGVSGSGSSSQELVVMRMDQNGSLIDYGAFGTPTDEILYGAGQPFDISPSGAITGVTTGNGGYLGGDDILFYRINSYSDFCQPATVIIQASDIALQSFTFNYGTMAQSWVFTPVAFTGQDNISNQGFVCLDFTPLDSCDLLPDFSVNTNYCFGDSTVFTNLSTAVTGNVDLSIWDFGDGSAPVFSSSNSVYHHYLSPGSYTVELVIIDTLSGCSDTTSQLINLIGNPSIDLVDTVFICPFDSISISATGYCLSSNSVVDWYEDSLILTESGLQATISAQQSQYVYISVSDNGTMIIDSVFIEVYQNCCVSDAIISVVSGNSCVGSDLVVDQNSIVSGSAPTFNWSFLPDGNPPNYSGSMPPTITFPTPGTKQVVLELNDSCGVFYDTVDIIISGPPEFNAGTGDTLCETQVIQLGESGIGGWNYNWSPGAVFDDSTSSNPILVVDSSLMITVEVTDSWSECSSLDTLYFIKDSVFVDILIEDSIICGNSITIPVDYYSSMDLIWSPASNINTYYLDSVNAAVTSTITFVAIATSEFGTCTASDSVLIQSGELPPAVYMDTIACFESGFMFIPTGSWYSNGNVVPAVILNDPGHYYYSETVECGTVTHEIILDFQYCTCSMWVPNSFTPGEGKHNNDFIPVTDCELEYYKIEIYNRWGELIFESTDINEVWDGTFKNHNVQDGTYTWKIEYADSFTGVHNNLVGHVNVLR